MDKSTSDERPPALFRPRLVLVDEPDGLRARALVDALAQSGGMAPRRTYRARCMLTKRELLGDRPISP